MAERKTNLQQYKIHPKEIQNHTLCDMANALFLYLVVNAQATNAAVSIAKEDIFCRLRSDAAFRERYQMKFPFHSIQ
jgi:hypothetical protein